MGEEYREVHLPYTAPIRPTYLREMLAGKQIARLVGTFPEANPFGGSMGGLELTDAIRIVFMAQPTPPHSTFGARIVWTQFERLKIITPQRLNHFGRSRRQAGENPANRIQERVEGEVILGVPTTPEPNEFGGETIRLELLGGGDLLIKAIPKATPNFTANHVWQWRRGAARNVFVMGRGAPRNGTRPRR